MFDEVPIPSKSDLNLLNNLSIQGENIIEDLYTIFSYHRPKDYKIYVSNLKYNPLDKNKIFLDLITTIQKYDKFVKKQKALYKELGKDNKDFFKLYRGRKLFGKSVTADTCGEILNNILPKYEQRHVIFKDKFLKKNIFHKSGLLPYTLEENVNYFDEEIRKLGINNYKSIKYIKFIEKLYKEIQNTLERETVNTFTFIYENQAERLFQLRQERILKANMDKVRKKEIKFEKKEIKKLKKLIDIANVTYEKIMESIYNSKGRNKKSKSKSKSRSKSKKNKNNDTNNNIEENNKVEKNEKNIRILKLIKKGQSEEKESDSKFSSKYLNKQNRTLFSEHTNNTNNTTFFNRITTSTGYGDTKSSKTSNHFTFYNIRNDLLNKLNNIKLKKEKEKEKEKEQLIFKPLPINTKTFSRNKIQVSFFPKISKKTINEQDNNINIMTNPMLNSASNIFKLLKSSSSAPSILNPESKKEKNNIEQTQEKKVIKKIIKKKKFLKKKLKGESVALINERRKKVPIVYEQLKKLRNALNLKRKNTNLNQSSKTFELLSKIYTKKKILNINEQKMPKELYNTYYNMSVSIDNNKTSEVFKRYKKMLDDNIDQNLDRIKEQDDNLKTKYLDLIHALIKKKLVKEN